ncbi:hypothetical protein [Roseobacter litoralis]|uniref:hypothetical protein n=1 Tax=Roseobacter litoralis TaxID=42443 RepID=UPI0024955A17|nr:hypothetical protein [Roseobacter litoralis]
MDKLERQRAAESAGHPEWAELPDTMGGAWREDVTQYFTGRSCPHGHVAPKTRSGGQCIECRRIKDREYRKTPQQMQYMRDYMRERYRREREQR